MAKHGCTNTQARVAGRSAAPEMVSWQLLLCYTSGVEHPWFHKKKCGKANMEGSPFP